MHAGSNVIDVEPPQTDRGGGGGGWAWLVTARGLIEAQLVRGVLEASGITPIALDASDPSPGSWLFLSGNINALVRIYVPRALLDEARLALLEIGFDAPEQPEPHRPSRRAPLRGRLVWLGVTLLIIALYVIAVFRSPLIGT